MSDFPDIDTVAIVNQRIAEINAIGHNPATCSLCQAIGGGPIAQQLDEDES